MAASRKVQVILTKYFICINQEHYVIYLQNIKFERLILWPGGVYTDAMHISFMNHDCIGSLGSIPNEPKNLAKMKTEIDTVKEKTDLKATSKQPALKSESTIKAEDSDFHEKFCDPLTRLLQPNVIEGLEDLTEAADMFNTENDRIDMESNQQENDNLEYLFSSPKLKKCKLSGFTLLASELSSPKVKGTPKVARSRKSENSPMSNVSKTLDFFRLSPQAAQLTRHQQSPKYL